MTDASDSRDSEARREAERATDRDAAAAAADTTDTTATETATDTDATRTAAVPVERADRTDPVTEAHRDTTPVPPPPPPAVAPVTTPAAVDSPPRKHGNRLVATLWVLLAAGLFEVGYLLLVTGLVALVDGPSVVGAEMTQFLQTPYITWLPVTLFFVLYELTVLLLGRAGRFAYVVASLIVGLLVWILTGQLLGLVQLHTLPPGAALARTLEAPYIVLIGVLAREIMLWTGYAIGARGRRVRHANRRAREEYDARQRAGARG